MAKLDKAHLAQNYCVTQLTYELCSPIVTRYKAAKTATTSAVVMASSSWQMEPTAGDMRTFCFLLIMWPRGNQAQMEQDSRGARAHAQVMRVAGLALQPLMRTGHRTKLGQAQSSTQPKAHSTIS